MKNPHFILYIFLLLINLTFLSGKAQEINDDAYIINQYFQLNQDPLLLLENEMLTANVQDNFWELNQAGNNNHINIKASDASFQEIHQFGNDNYYNFIDYYNNSSSNFNILQQGDSNFLQIYGVNTLIKNMSIIQKSNYKTLIIKNY